MKEYNSLSEYIEEEFPNYDGWKEEKKEKNI